MRTWFALFYVAGLNVAVDAQEIPQDQVPSVVLNAFQGKFSHATAVEWEAKGELYRGEFEVASRDHGVWIDKSGKITKHKEDFPRKDLPEAVKQKLATEFKAYKLDDADKIEMDGKIFYQVDLDGTSDDREVLFTEDGKVQENKVD